LRSDSPFLSTLPPLAPPSFSFLMIPRPPTSTLFPYTTLFRSSGRLDFGVGGDLALVMLAQQPVHEAGDGTQGRLGRLAVRRPRRSEEHTSELQSLTNLVCRLLLEKKKKQEPHTIHISRHQPRS